MGERTEKYGPVHFLLSSVVEMRGRKVQLLLGVEVLAVGVFVVECVHYPNIGLPFGYWADPNRALRAFRQCAKVNDARVGFVNHDLAVIEEFTIVASYDGGQGLNQTEIAFPEFPTRWEIDERLAQIGCE